jgi:hypothetical protein
MPWETADLRAERREGLIPVLSKTEAVFVTLFFNSVVLAYHAHVSKAFERNEKIHTLKK